jgi:autotransporter translocation and assembly factor TamB
MNRVLKIPLYIIAVIILLAVSVAYLYYFTTLPERELNDWIDFKALNKTGYSVSFERINRDIWDRVSLEGVTIAPGAGKSGPSIKISRINLKYDILQLVKGRYSFDSLVIDSVLVSMADLQESEAGEQDTTAAVFSPPRISIGDVAINHVAVVLSADDIIFVDSAQIAVSAEDDNLRVRFRSLVGRWPKKDFEVEDLTGEVAVATDGLHLTDIDLVTSRSRLRLAGPAGISLINDMNLTFECSPIDLEDISALTGVKIGGELDCRGNVDGDFDNFSGQAVIDGVFMDKPYEDVELSYSFEGGRLALDSIDGGIFHAGFKGQGAIDFVARPEEYEFQGRVSHLDLREIGPEIRTDFSGQVEMAGRGFSESQFGMNVQCDLDSASIEDFFFDEVTGRVKFDLERISFLPGFKARYKNTILTASGDLVYAGDIDIAGNAKFGVLTDFTDQIFLRQLGGRGSAGFHLTGPTQNFDIDAFFDSDSCWTYGLETGEIHIYANLRSFTGHRVGKVSGRWVGGSLYSIPTDSGYFETSISGERVFLDTVFIAGMEGGIWLKGLYDGTRVPPVFQADSILGDIYGNRFSSLAPVILKIHPDNVEFDEFLLGYLQGILDLDGTVTNDLEMSVNVEAMGFQIEPILSQVMPQRQIRGIWNGSAFLRGNFEDPDITFNLEIDSLSVGQVYLGNLEARAEYSKGYVATEYARLKSDYGIYDFHGRLPLDLSFAEVENRLPENPIDFSMESSGSRLLLSEAFISNVERFDTDFAFRINLSGTYANPRLTGSGEMKDGVLKVMDLVNPLTDLRASIRMENEIVYVDSVSATVAGEEKDWSRTIGKLLSKGDGRGKKPLITASGTLKLLGLGEILYNLDIKGENVYFMTDAYDVSGLVDLDLNVRGEMPPTIYGKIRILRLDIKDEFQNFIGPDYDPAISVVEDSTLWNLDLDVSAVNNIWIKNSEMDAELKADIRIRRQVGIMRFLGELETIRGSYNLLGLKRFDFESGRLIYKDLATVDPDIDFLLTTRRRVTGEKSGPVPYTLEIHVGGTLLEPEISSPNLSQEDLLRELLKGSVAGEPFTDGGSTAELLSSVTNLATSMGIDPLTAYNIIEEFEIDAYGDETRISIAKYLSRNLNVGLSGAVSRDVRGSISMEYYINDNMLFRATQGMQGSENEGISLDFDINFEF